MSLSSLDPDERMSGAESSETIRLLRRRASVRAFAPDPVPEDLLRSIIVAARQAPTSSNLQAYSIVVVADAERRHALSVIAGNQQHILDAPVLLALCADIRRLALVTEQAGAEFAAHTVEMLLVSCVDASLAGMCASIAAESLGLGTVMIGGLRNDPEAVAAILGLPPQTFVVFGLCIGWPERSPPPKQRLPSELTVGREHYPETSAGEDGGFDLLQPDPVGAAWTQRVAREMSNPRRAGLGAALKRLGFRF